MYFVATKVAWQDHVEPSLADIERKNDITLNPPLFLLKGIKFSLTTEEPKLLTFQQLNKSVINVKQFKIFQILQYFCFLKLFSQTLFSSLNSRQIFKIQVFEHYKNFLIIISLQPDGVNVCYFKLGLFYLTEFII